jgi:hypothetical protein
VLFPSVPGARARRVVYDLPIDVKRHAYSFFMYLGGDPGVYGFVWWEPTPVISRLATEPPPTAVLALPVSRCASECAGG